MKYFSFSTLSKLLPQCGDLSDQNIYTIAFEGQTMIPEDSLVRFFQYRTVYFGALYSHRDEGDEEMINIKRRLIELFYDAQNTWEETYTRQQIADIFGVSIQDVKKALRKQNRFKVFLPREITVTDILIYLKDHSEVVEKLEERRDMLLATDPMMEAPVRHILMLYSYYQSHGYII